MPPLAAELDEVVGLRVVHDHAPAEAAPELGRDQQPDLARRRPPQQPPATRIVSWATPSRSSSSTAAAIAACRGPCSADGIGSDGCSITTVAVPPRVTSSVERRAVERERSASRTAGRDVVERFARRRAAGE